MAQPILSYSKMLYRPIWQRLAVPASLTINGTTYTTMPDGTQLLANDKTVGAQVNQQGGIMLETMTPMAELIYEDVLTLGLTEDDLDDSTITLNENTWTITAHRMNPSPRGSADGTVYLMLESAADA